MKKTWDIAAQMNIGDKSLASQKKMTKTMNDISFCVFGDLATARAAWGHPR